MVKPDWNPVNAPADDSIIIAKGERGIAGWALMQSSVFFSFRYQSSSGEKVAAIATDFAMPLGDPQGPINPSYVVLCGGRDAAGGTLAMAANGRFSTPATAVPPTDTMVTSLAHASVGGYAANDLHHDFGGRVYETAVWRLPATRANIEAKTAAILGLFMPDGSTTVSYVRDREGYYPGVGAGAPYHTAWKNQPRIDPAGKGFLFGLQATNRVQYPEALQLWSRTPAGGAGAPVVTPNDALPPGDADIANAARILLARRREPLAPPHRLREPGGRPRPDLGARGGNADRDAHGRLGHPGHRSADAAGLAGHPARGADHVDERPAHRAQRRPARPRSGRSTSGTTARRPSSSTPGAWSSPSWAGTSPASRRPVIPLGFDPGPTIYSSLATQPTREVLTLPALSPSTAATGFCIGAEAQPPTGMTWQGPFFDRRTLVGGPSRPTSRRQTVQAHGHGHGGRHLLEMFVQGAVNGFAKADFSIPVDTSARIKGCVAPNGTMTLYVNDVALTPAGRVAAHGRAARPGRGRHLGGQRPHRNRAVAGIREGGGGLQALRDLADCQ